MSDILALTVQQPWAWAIAHGGKRVENRVWTTRHRGLLAIHAGKGWDVAGALDPAVVANLGITGVDLAANVGGAVVAVATLDGCHRADACCRPWGQVDCWHWALSEVVPLPDPVSCRGFQGLWPLPDEVARLVRGQLPPALERAR